MPHLTRPEHDWRHPVHVTMRRVRLAPSLREERVYAAILVQLFAAKARGTRVLQYSVQHDHLHLMIEGDDRGDLGRRMKFLFSRIALAVNRIAMRRGSLFVDRHHRHALKTPTEVRRALVYILFNTRKHASTWAPPPSDTPSSVARAQNEIAETAAGGIRAGPSGPFGLSRRSGVSGVSSSAWDLDPFSSAPWFGDWHPNAKPPDRPRRDAPATSRPQTWLARIGWQRAGGLLRFDETPRSARPTRTRTRP